jgi:hypothetical protein
LAAGFADRDIRRALAARLIFRVRHGWYARAGTAEAVARAVRVGGMVTGVEALRLRGLFLPRPARVDIAVPRNSSALRSPSRMRQRLSASDPVRVHWVTGARSTLRSRDWLADEDDALVLILHTAPRDLAVAACDGVIRYLGWDAARLDAAFRRAPRRVQAWRSLVDGRADSWGETAVRLQLMDAGIRFEPRAEVPGVGLFDGRVSEGVYIEVDGAQHDETWAGDEPSSFERDHLKDLGLAAIGARSIRITYQLFESRWAECVAAIRVAIECDRRLRHGSGARARRLTQAPRKLRTLPREPRDGRATRRPAAQSPEFSQQGRAGAARARQPAARAPNVRR